MKNLMITIIVLFIGAFAYAQDAAIEGSYTIECSKKQEKKISLSEESKILIESNRSENKDTTIKVGEYYVRIMSEEKLSQGIRWAKYTIVSNKK